MNMHRFKIKNLVDVQSGYAFKSSLFNESIGMPLIRIRNVTSGLIDTYYKGEYEENYIVNDGDLLVSMDGQFRLIRWCNGKALLNQRVCRINVKEANVLKEYLYYFLPRKLKEIENRTPFVTVKHLSVKDINEIDIVVPPLETQKKIVAVLDKAQALIDARKAQITLLDDLIQSVFYEMFGDPVTNPKGWEMRKLLDFYLDGKNAIKCGPFGSALKKDEYRLKGVPVWNMDNIQNARFIDEPNLFINEDKYKQLKAYAITNGDIIISRAGTVGKMCLIDTKYPKSIISTNLIRLRLNKYLKPIFFVSLMTFYGPKVCRLKTGAEDSFSHMNTGILNNISFPYPSIDLQNQFAEKVQKIESQKQLLQQSLTDLETNFNSLMQKSFNGELFPQ